MHREHKSGNNNNNNNTQNRDRWKPKRLQQSKQDALLWYAQ